jgi:hypothetical protein
VTNAELTALLQDFYRSKAAIRERHVAGATRVENYDFNNTYQYVINREDAQLSWLRTALQELGTGPTDTTAAIDLPHGKGADGERAVIEDDARLSREFAERWAAPVQNMSHARHRRMLEVILGETREQQRFFEQMLRGREDLLGRRHKSPGTGGGVLPTRWVE